jgi:RIO kinase 1
VQNINDFFGKTLNAMSTRQLFEFITTPLTVSETKKKSENDGLAAEDEAELAALDAIMKHVEDESIKLQKESLPMQRKRSQQAQVDDAVFMSQFIPRSLNQVAEHEIALLQKGEVEETYAHAVAALTGNKDVVDAVMIQQKQHQSQSVPSILKSSEKEKAKLEQGDSSEKHAHFDANDPEESSVTEEDDMESNSSDDDDWTETSFNKQIMTPADVQAAKEAQRVANKANKKAVKEARSEKRQNKIKKKDKKTAINKTKGNKKKK